METNSEAQFRRNYTILDLPFDILRMVFRHLETSDVAFMFTVHKHCEEAAIYTIKQNLRENILDPFKIYFNRSHEKYLRLESVYKILKHLSESLTNLQIIGNVLPYIPKYTLNSVNPEDIRFISSIPRICPNVENLIFTNIVTRDLQMLFFKQFQMLISVELDLSLIGGRMVSLKNVTRFKASVISSIAKKNCKNCWDLSKHQSLSEREVVDFCINNPTFKSITLTIVGVCEHCRIKRSFAKSNDIHWLYKAIEPKMETMVIKIGRERTTLSKIYRSPYLSNLF